MRSIIFYSYIKCLTCRKALNWLNKNNISYQLIDIVKYPPSKKLLKSALIKYSSDKKKIFNTRGKSFKLIDCNIKELSDEKIIEFLSKDGKLIKRPFIVINEDEFLLGFNEAEFANEFL